MKERSVQQKALKKMPFARVIVRKLGLSPQEYEASAFLGVCDALRTFDATKGEIDGHIYSWVKMRVLRQRRQDYQIVSTSRHLSVKCSLGEQHEGLHDIMPGLETKEVTEKLVKFARRHKTPVVADTIELYFKSDLTISEVARARKLSRETVRECIADFSARFRPHAVKM